MAKLVVRNTVTRFCSKSVHICDTRTKLELPGGGGGAAYGGAHE